MALRVVIYGRPGCHLCDEAADRMREIARRVPIAFETVDIEGDDELHRRYLERIPVIAVGTEVVAELDGFRAANLEAALLRAGDASPAARDDSY